MLPLKFDGGGYRAGGKAMFDSEGNLWVGDNFTVGWQGQDTLWQGNATKFAPNGKPLSPITTGFAGGGMQGGTFGAAVDAKDNAWLTSYGGKSIAVFDKNGKPLTPPEGITFDGKLGLMQGVIVTPSGDVWVAGRREEPARLLPQGRSAPRAGSSARATTVEPCKSFLGPFHLGIDQQDRIWVTNAFGDHVTRFPAVRSEQGREVQDRLQRQRPRHRQPGQRLGDEPVRQLGCGAWSIMVETWSYAEDRRQRRRDYLTRPMSEQKGGPTAAASRCCGRTARQYPGSPFTGGGLPGPWAVAVDGNDNVWISNFADAEQPDRAAVRRAHRELPARLQDRRPDLAARRLRRRRPADADRHRRRSRRATSG